MTDFLFPPAPVVALPVVGQGACYPVTRIFCVGRNYAAHAAEMGNEVDREAPFYFTKTPAAVLHSGAPCAMPRGTANLHHEVELVFALGAEAVDVTIEAGWGAIWGWGVGLDMTRRDLQDAAKAKRRPWDLSKDFEASAILGPLTPAAAAPWDPARALTLEVNGVTRQTAQLGDMVWSPGEIVAHLSGYYRLRPGDLVMTGTPAGVSAVVAGDAMVGRVDGLAEVTARMVPAT